MSKKNLKRVIVFGIAITIILLSENTFPLSGTIPETGVNIKIQKEWKGFHSDYREATSLVIKTEEQWKEVWERVHLLRLPRPELPKIDFQKEMVIAVFMGERSSGGYSIEIIKITKTAKEIVVVVKGKEPPPGSLRTMVLTQPFHIAVVKGFSLPVRFQNP